MTCSDQLDVVELMLYEFWSLGLVASALAILEYYLEAAVKEATFLENERPYGGEPRYPGQEPAPPANHMSEGILDPLAQVTPKLNVVCE